MSDFKKIWIENGIEEIGIEVEFDYSPSEPMTRHYPGCDACLEICGATLDNHEICLLPDAQIELETQLLEDRYEDEINDYADYSDWVYIYNFHAKH